VGEITKLKRSVFAVKVNNSKAAHAGTGFFLGVSRSGSTAFRFGKVGFNSTRINQRSRMPVQHRFPTFSAAADAWPAPAVCGGDSRSNDEVSGPVAKSLAKL